jgi:methyl-accepting chemotaxis protein
MKTWTIGKRITVGFAVVLLIMFALGLLTFARLRVVQTHSNAITQATIPSLNLLGEIELLKEQNTLLVYQHISSTTEADMNRLEAKINQNSDQRHRSHTESWRTDLDGIHRRHRQGQRRGWIIAFEH